MTYAAKELSTQDGRPVELYEFSYSNNYWRFTSADRTLLKDTTPFTAVPISRSNITTNNDPTQGTLTVNVSRDNDIGELWRIQPPSDSVVLTIYAEHWLDGDFRVIWKGRVTNAKWTDDNTIELSCESIFTSLQRMGLRRKIQLQCPFALYGSECGVSRAQWVETRKVATINGNLVTLVSANATANWYAGGMITWTNADRGNTERRMIRYSTVGGILTLSAQTVGLVGGMDVQVYPGCDHTLEGDQGCAKKFMNFNRFGGTPFLPDLNPFDGSATIF